MIEDIIKTHKLITFIAKEIVRSRMKARAKIRKDRMESEYHVGRVTAFEEMLSILEGCERRCVHCGQYLPGKGENHGQSE